MPIPFESIPKFAEHVIQRKSFRNPFGKFVMDPSGEMHPYVLDWLRRVHPLGRQTWTVMELRNLYFDLELQRRQEQVSLSPYVVVISLLNVHRQLKLWSHPSVWRGQSNRQIDISCWEDFRAIVWPPLMQAITGKGGGQLRTMTEHGGVEGDVSFAHYLLNVSNTTGIKGSDVRPIIIFPTPIPCTGRAYRENYDLLAIPPPDLVRDRYPLHPNTAVHETLPVWRRPGVN